VRAPERTRREAQIKGGRDRKKKKIPARLQGNEGEVKSDEGKGTRRFRKQREREGSEKKEPGREEERGGRPIGNLN